MVICPLCASWKDEFVYTRFLYFFLRRVESLKKNFFIRFLKIQCTIVSWRRFYIYNRLTWEWSSHARDASLTRVRPNVPLQQGRSVEFLIAAVTWQPRLLLPAYHRNSIFIFHLHFRIHVDRSDVTGRMRILPRIRVCVRLFVAFRYCPHVDYVFRFLLKINNRRHAWEMTYVMRLMESRSRS